MSKFTRASEARDQIEAIIADVVDSGEPVLLGRNGEPEVVLLPYKDYLKGKELPSTTEDVALDVEFDAMLNQAHRHFKNWLVERGYNPETLSEEDVERIIREA
jgi:prevent-host-death family protein